MSIPKEPRQLMINIMYLVLTAMLALNVSAKIINAFFVINRGIKNSTSVLNQSNEKTVENLAKAVKTNPATYGKLNTAAAEVQRMSKEFNDYVEGLRGEMVKQTGGMYPDTDEHHAGQPKGYKNKDITTRFMVNQGNGEKLYARINADREKLLSIVKGLRGISLINDKHIAENLEPSITLKVDEKDWKKERGVNNWSEYTFKQLPLAAAFPLLSKYQQDMKSSEAAVLNYLLGQVGAVEFKVDNFIPIASAKKNYVIAGEPFEAEISVAASSKSITDNVNIAVNGRSLSVAEGVAKYTETASSTGVKPYKVDVTLTNPTTNERKTYSKTFEYEVGRRSVTVSADKMNVFYMGVENPVSVVAAGVSSNELNVGFNGNVRRLGGGGGKFTVMGTAEGKATVSVSGGGLKATSFEFRVKRIPDPVAKVAGKTGGELGNGVLKAQGGVIPVLENFDFEARCDIQGFKLIYVARRQDPEQSVNPGGAFNGTSRALLNKAKPGDQYIFDDVRAKCPGDAAGRTINSVTLRVL
jgi:gliding motility-associated protein GldM